MKKIYILIFISLFFLSCNKKSNETLFFLDKTTSYVEQDLKVKINSYCYNWIHYKYQENPSKYKNLKKSIDNIAYNYYQLDNLYNLIILELKVKEDSIFFDKNIEKKYHDTLNLLFQKYINLLNVLNDNYKLGIEIDTNIVKRFYLNNNLKVFELNILFTKLTTLFFNTLYKIVSISEESEVKFNKDTIFISLNKQKYITNDLLVAEICCRSIDSSKYWQANIDGQYYKGKKKIFLTKKITDNTDNTVDGYVFLSNIFDTIRFDFKYTYKIK